MNAEERAIYIEDALRFAWPGINGDESLECLIDDPLNDPQLFYKNLAVPKMRKGLFSRLFERLKRLFNGK